MLGATGGAGRALVAELARQGRRVRAVSRRATDPWPKGVEAVTADILRADEVRKACRDAAVVYHAANVPYAQWQQVLPVMTESVIAAASAADAVLVVADNLYMYGPPSGPMAEDSPRRVSGPKGQLRARLEEAFLAAHTRGRVGVAIGRGSDFYGPHGCRLMREVDVADRDPRLIQHGDHAAVHDLEMRVPEGQSRRGQARPGAGSCDGPLS